MRRPVEPRDGVRHAVGVYLRQQLVPVFEKNTETGWEYDDAALHLDFSRNEVRFQMREQEFDLLGHGSGADNHHDKRVVISEAAIEHGHLWQCRVKRNELNRFCKNETRGHG